MPGTAWLYICVAPHVWAAQMARGVGRRGINSAPLIYFPPTQTHSLTSHTNPGITKTRQICRASAAVVRRGVHGEGASAVAVQGAAAGSAGQCVG